MASEIVALLFSGSFLAVIGLSLWLRRHLLSLADVFLFSIAVYFGAYTLIDVSVVGVRGFDPTIVAAVHCGIAVCAFAVWAFARFGPRRIVDETSLARLTHDWKACPGPLIAAMLVAIVGFRFYTAMVIETYSVESRADLETFENQLPYWFTAIGILAPAMLFTAGTASWAKYMTSVGTTKRLFWLALTLTAAAFLFWQGRRPMFAFFVLVFWTVGSIGRLSTKRWLLILLVSAIAAPFLIAISNLFQAYRWASFRGAPVVSEFRYESFDSIVKRATSVERTVANLRKRQAIWRFNYAVMNSHQRGDGELQWGLLLVSSVPNYIPAVLYPGKKSIFETEGELQKAMNLEYRDLGENIFVMTYGDFGLLGFLVAPLMIIAFVMVSAEVLRRIYDPFLRLLLMGLCLYYALNMEAQYTTPIGVARDFVVLAAAYFVVRTVARALYWVARGPGVNLR
jgi:hypothetical protein